MALNFSGNVPAMSTLRNLSNYGGSSQSEQKLRGINKGAVSLLKESPRLSTPMSIATAKDDPAASSAPHPTMSKPNKLEIQRPELAAKKLPTERLKAQQESLDAANKEQQSLSPVGLRFDFSA